MKFRTCSAVLLFLLSFKVVAQTDLQRVTLRSLSFQYQTNLEGEKRCLQWKPLDPGQDRLLFDDEGRPYLNIVLRAAVLKGCKVKNLSPQVLKQITKNPKDLRFQMRVSPPATVAYIQGPDFKDELLVEAPVDTLREVSFFDYFKQSSVYLEGRYLRLTTNNQTPYPRSYSIFPAGGGYVAIPVPGLPRFSLGITMLQNLGNFFPNDQVRVQYSEYAFDTGFTIFQDLLRARPRMRFALELRGRNIFQSSDARPFIMGSVVAPYVAVQSMWLPWARRPWEHNISRWGLEGGARLSVGGKVQNRSLTAYQVNTGFFYRLTKKWALGVGYNHTHQQVNFVPAIKENANDLYMRLYLLPFTGEDSQVVEVGSGT